VSEDARMEAINVALAALDMRHGSDHVMGVLPCCKMTGLFLNIVRWSTMSVTTTAMASTTQERAIKSSLAITDEGRKADKLLDAHAR